MTHRELAVILAAVLCAGSANASLAQGTGGGRAPSPGIGGGGTFTAPTPGIGTGGMAPSIAPTPGVGTGAPPNATPTPGIGTTPNNPPGTITGGPPSSGPSGEKASGEKPPSGGPARSLADIKEETEASIPYKPCPANVRFPNGQQMCLGFPGPGRPYRAGRPR
jgi:hypothetical protein